MGNEQLLTGRMKAIPIMLSAATCCACMPLQLSISRQTLPYLSACRSPCSCHNHSPGGGPSCAHRRELQVRGQALIFCLGCKGVSTVGPSAFGQFPGFSAALTQHCSYRHLLTSRKCCMCEDDCTRTRVHPTGWIPLIKASPFCSAFSSG